MPFKILRSLFLFAFICLLCYGNAVRYRMTRDLGLAMSIIDQEYVEPADSKRLYFDINGKPVWGYDFETQLSRLKSP